MKRYGKRLMTIAAAVAATIVVSITLCACQGRRMSNMEPNGETVEVVILPDTTLSPEVPAVPN